MNVENWNITPFLHLKEIHRNILFAFQKNENFRKNLNGPKIANAAFSIASIHILLGGLMTRIAPSLSLSLSFSLSLSQVLILSLSLSSLPPSFPLPSSHSLSRFLTVTFLFYHLPIKSR